MMQWIKKLFGFGDGEDEFNTPIIEKLKEEQEIYIDVLKKLIKSLKDKQIEVLAESQILLESKDIPAFFRQSRIDALYKDGNKFHQAEAKIVNPPEFSAMTETWRDVDIVLNPFVWHAMEFRVIGPEPSIIQMQNWFSRWFDPKDRIPEDGNGLHSVIHTMTVPKVVGGTWNVTIDFGSANIEAFIAFFKQCKFSGANRIEISSANYLRSFNMMISSTDEPLFDDSRF